MRKINLITTVLMMLTMLGFAQRENEILRDDLNPHKKEIMSRFIPMYDGQYAHALYKIPPAEMLDRLENFKRALLAVAVPNTGSDVNALRAKDADYEARNILHRYMGLYGMDSVGMVDFEKFMEEEQGDPDFEIRFPKARKKAFPIEMDSLTWERLREVVDGTRDLNDEALFKRSAAYRTWVDDYLESLLYAEYREYFATDYDRRFLAKLAAVKEKVGNPLMREHLLFDATAMVLKMMSDDDAKEKAYKEFMSVATVDAYRNELQTLYQNYQDMVNHAMAPDFTFPDVDGNMVSLRELRGKYVYIDVWATWCRPCKAEIPHLAELEQDYDGKNIHFVSLSVDRNRDKSAWVNYVKTHHLGGIQLIADDDFKSAFVMKFNINSIPRFILIDPQGRIISGDAKRPSDPELRTQLDELLNN